MIYLTYGRDLSSNLIHISEAARGAQAGLRCPFCGSPLVAKKGPEVIWHFAHAADESCRQSGAADLIPSYEGYFVYGLTPAQRLTLASVFEAQRTERPLLRCQRIPSCYQGGPGRKGIPPPDLCALWPWPLQPPPDRPAHHQGPGLRSPADPGPIC
jgi:hypothetical protein